MARVLTTTASFTYATLVRRLLPLVFPAFAIILTWPLMRQVTTHVPLGSEPTETVPFLNVWTIGWNGMRLIDGFSDYWDAPIYYPTQGAFAFSDPQPLTALPGALLWSSSPALAYNAVLLVYLTLNGYVTYRVLRQRGFAFGPAMAGGLLMQALPFVTNERGVLQLQPIFAPIWAIGAMWNLLERSSVKRGLELGLALGLTFLTSEYFALLLIPALALVLLLHMPNFRKTDLLRQLGFALAIGLALALPIGLPQASRLEAMDFQRSESSFAGTSAWSSDYLRPSSRLRVSEVMPEFDLRGNQHLYPGAVLVGLAIFGVAVAIRGELSKRRWIAFLIATGGLGFVLSLGSHLTIAGTAPLAVVHQAVPFLGYTRSAFRYGALVQLTLVLLAVEGLAMLWTRNRAVAVAVATLAILELAPLPERVTEVPNIQPEWAATLAEVDRPIIVHIPYAPGRSASSYVDTTRWMIESLPIEARLVNGYSGFFPAQNARMRDVLQDFPDDRSFEALKELGVDFVVLHDPNGPARVIDLVHSGQVTGYKAFEGGT
jgi:hypothetical protein